jgi:superfamily II DNA or RNA helicase
VTPTVDRRLRGLLLSLLADGEPRDVKVLLGEVRARGGAGVSRAAVERCLHGDPAFDQDTEAPGRPRWRLAARTSGDGHGDAAPNDGGSGPAETRAHLDALDLRPWQAEALAAWSATGRGVVEAVTGTGKTRLAVAAARIVLDRGGRVLVLVPTLELQDQWARALREVLPGVSIGRLGGGGDADLYDHDVVLATPHSAASLPLEPPPGRLGLLVADEAHRYGAPTWGAALGDAFQLRLALTATFERNDEGVADVLAPYFGEVVTRYGFDRAVADGTVAPFAIAIASVALSDEERAAYDSADRRVRQLRRELVGSLGMPKEPRALLAAVAAVVADGEAGGRDGPQVRACREYLVRIRERRDVTATAAGKLAVCRAVAPVLRGGRSLVFTDTVEQAEDAARLLVAGGVAAEIVHGQLPTERRRIRLAQFRRGRIDTLVAPRVLDEGVDVPDADVAVVLASFRTRRQLIQRLGRVLRTKADGREARLVLAVAADTAEDPDHGGHDGFLTEVRDVAREVTRLDVDADPGSLTTWLGGTATRSADGRALGR